MLGKRVSGNHFFFKIFWRRDPARGIRAFGARGRPAAPAAVPRTSTLSCRETMPVPLQIDFTPYAYGFRAKEPSVDLTRQVNMSVFCAEVFIVNWRADLRK